MTELFYGVALLACPLGMGAMMWMMMRGGKESPAPEAAGDEVAALRGEVERLRAERRFSAGPR